MPHERVLPSVISEGIRSPAMNLRDGSFVNELEVEVEEVEKHQWKKPELPSGTKTKVILSN